MVSQKLELSNSVIPLAEPWLPDDCGGIVSRQIASTFVGPGPVAESFGRQLAELAGVMTAIPVSSGTTALSICAHVLGLKAGDEIIIPAYGVISVINAFSTIGIKTKLVEINRATGCIDPECLIKVINQKTKAVVFVDFCGSIGPELVEIATICKDHGIYLIEDAAWSLGRNFEGRKGGGHGDIAITSFSVPKLITTGQGGAIFVSSESGRNKAICAIDQGDVDWRKTNINRGIGGNFRLSDVSAALGIAQLTNLAERLSRKEKSFTKLASILDGKIFHSSDGKVPMQNIVFTKQPDELVAYLRKHGVLAARQYRPYYHHPPYQHLGSIKDFPNSEYWFNHAVYLPFGIALDELSAEKIGVCVVDSKIQLISNSDEK
jgi:perosamine synthetase